jgi:hypothetical protein
VFTIGLCVGGRKERDTEKGIKEGNCSNARPREDLPGSWETGSRRGWGRGLLYTSYKRQQLSVGRFRMRDKPRPCASVFDARLSAAASRVAMGNWRHCLSPAGDVRHWPVNQYWNSLAPAAAAAASASSNNKLPNTHTYYVTIDYSEKSSVAGKGEHQ